MRSALARNVARRSTTSTTSLAMALAELVVLLEGEGETISKVPYL